MSSDVVVHEQLPADPRSAHRARRAVRSVVAAHRPEWADRAELAVTELVTNAVVHAGTDIELWVRLRPTSVRVEIHDGTTAVPSRRSHSATAATGRGLHLVDDSVDRWDVETHRQGKTVWFEIGDPMPSTVGDAPLPQEALEVGLQRVPLLLHAAWQEHAAALLREYLLVRLDEDPDILERHAQASEALGLLYDQVPAPVLPGDPGGVLAASVEPAVTAESILLRVPRSSVASFAALDDLLARARELADGGSMLGPPTQPEASEMRAWLCRQVRLAESGHAPMPWAGPGEPAGVVHDPAAIDPAHRALAATTAAVLATDERSVIVAVSATALALLGYDDEADLLGHRVIRVIPARFHQAHLAGTTLHHTNGRSVLLGVRVVVPVVRADGSEAPVSMSVEARLVGDGLRAFVARFHPAA